MAWGFNEAASVMTRKYANDKPTAAGMLLQ